MCWMLMGNAVMASSVLAINLGYASKVFDPNLPASPFTCGMDAFLRCSLFPSTYSSLGYLLDTFLLNGRDLNNTEQLSDWLDSAYSYLAMVDYPYASNFLMPLPAYPIKEVFFVVNYCLLFNFL